MAQGARSIKNHCKMNLDETTSIISELREEISVQRMKIAKDKNAKKVTSKVEQENILKVSLTLLKVF